MLYTMVNSTDQEKRTPSPHRNVGANNGKPDAGAYLQGSKVLEQFSCQCIDVEQARSLVRLL
jgi:hypothetical protein